MHSAYYNDVIMYIFSFSNLPTNSSMIGKLFNDPRGRQWNFIKQYKHSVFEAYTNCSITDFTY